MTADDRAAPAADDTPPQTAAPPTAAVSGAYVPEFLGAWYAGDLASALRAYAERVPAAAPTSGPGSQDAPLEGGTFLAAWYAGDLAAAVRARKEHDAVRQPPRAG
ncbi:MAG: hypothetical protein ACKVZ6_15595 [Kineosporiaceae bacterium]